MCTVPLKSNLDGAQQLMMGLAALCLVRFVPSRRNSLAHSYMCMVLLFY